MHRPGRLILLLAAVATALACIAPASAQFAERAEDVEATAQLERTATTLGESVFFYLQVDNALFEAPELPEVDGARFAFRNYSDQTYSAATIVNGRVTSQTTVRRTFIYELIPTRSGTVNIPSFTVETPGLPGEPPRTRPLRLEVNAPMKMADVFVELAAPADAPFVGQPFDITIRIGFRKDVVRNDTQLTLPDGTGPFEPVRPANEITRRRSRGATIFMGGPVTFRGSKLTRDGMEYDVFTAERTVIPTEAGTFTLGPAVLALDYAPPRRNLQRFGIRTAVPSDPITITVKPLPAEGRPPNFSSLVGAYGARASANETRARVGDPISLYLTVEGPDPISRVEAPDLRSLPGFESFRIDPEDTQVQYLTAEQAEAGGLAQALFTYLIRPTTDAVEAIPAIELPYFDVERGRYGVARTDELPLRMAPSRTLTASDGQGATDDDGPQNQGLRSATGGIRPNVSGAALTAGAAPTLAGLIETPLIVVGAAAPPTALAGALAFGAVSRARDKHSPARRRAAGIAMARQALANTAHGDATGARSALAHAVAALAETERDPASITASDARTLLEALGADLAADAADLLDRCDASAYAGAETVADLTEDAKRTIDRIAEAV